MADCKPSCIFCDVRAYRHLFTTWCPQGRGVQVPSDTRDLPALSCEFARATELHCAGAVTGRGEPDLGYCRIHGELCRLGYRNRIEASTVCGTHKRRRPAGVRTGGRSSSGTANTTQSSVLAPITSTDSGSPPPGSRSGPSARCRRTQRNSPPSALDLGDSEARCRRDRARRRRRGPSGRGCRAPRDDRWCWATRGRPGGALRPARGRASC
jgi:hypothetical protein